MPVDLLILAGIALFVVLRLRGVLGQDVGHKPPAEKPYAKKTANEEAARVVKIELGKNNGDDAVKATVVEILDVSDVPEPLKDKVKALHAIDKQFTVSSFLQGAEAAFEMILSAYSKHDRATLKPLVNKEIYDQFCADMDEQRKRNERNDTTLLAVKEKTLKHVELEKNIAKITMVFSSEQVHVVRNVQNEIISGHSSQVELVEDEWTFERDMRSQNPNWTLIAT